MMAVQSATDVARHRPGTRLFGGGLGGAMISLGVHALLVVVVLARVGTSGGASAALDATESTLTFTLAAVLPPEAIDSVDERSGAAASPPTTSRSPTTRRPTTTRRREPALSVAANAVSPARNLQNPALDRPATVLPLAVPPPAANVNAGAGHHGGAAPSTPATSTATEPPPPDAVATVGAGSDSAQGDDGLGAGGGGDSGTHRGPGPGTAVRASTLSPAAPISAGDRRRAIERYLREVLTPRIRAHTIYPEEAERLGLEADFVVRIAVDGRGTLVEATLLGGGPHPLLKQSAFLALRTSAPWPPPPPLLGTLVQIDVPFVFRLEG